MVERTFGRPDLLAAYTPAMLTRVGASRTQLDSYRAAVLAFNGAPNETGYTLPDRSGALGADLDDLETLDRQPEVLAQALRLADSFPWSPGSVPFLAQFYGQVATMLLDPDWALTFAQLYQTHLDSMVEVLRDASQMPADQFAENADEIADAFAWIAQQGAEDPAILEAAFGDWGPAQINGLLANLSHYATEDGFRGIAPGDPETIERLLTPVADALGAATTAGVLDPAALGALTGGGGGSCPAPFDGFDERFHETQGRLLLLGHLDAFDGESAAGLAHHAIAAEPAVVEVIEQEQGFVSHLATPATSYLDHRFDGELRDILDVPAGEQRPPLMQDLTTYVLLGVGGWPGSGEPNEAAFHFTTSHPQAAYRALHDDAVYPQVAGDIIAEGLGRYPAHSTDPADAGRAGEVLEGWVQTWAEQDRGRFYAMPDELRQGWAVAVASLPDTLAELTFHGTSSLQEQAGVLFSELMRDESAARVLYDGASALQGDRLAEVLDVYMGQGSVIDLSELPDIDDRNRMREAFHAFATLDQAADNANVADELRGGITDGVSSVVFGLLPRGPVKTVLDGAGTVVDFVRLEDELHALDNEWSDTIDRYRGAQLLLLAHAANSQPEMLEAHLSDAERGALDEALALDDPVQRQVALDELWVGLDQGNEVKQLLTYLVDESIT